MDITEILIDSIKNKVPISFSKYGDGEYLCVTSQNGKFNCDSDNYTENLKNKLIESFNFIVNETDDCYIGMWFTSDIHDFWSNMTNSKIKFAKYHSLFLCDENLTNKVELYKTIKTSTLKKIMICNPLLIKAKYLFNIDYMIHVDFNNWFDTKFQLIFDQLLNIINSDEQYIIITSAGMGSKVLIAELKNTTVVIIGGGVAGIELGYKILANNKNISNITFY